MWHSVHLNNWNKISTSFTQLLRNLLDNHSQSIPHQSGTKFITDRPRSLTYKIYSTSSFRYYSSTVNLFLNLMNFSLRTSIDSYDVRSVDLSFMFMGLRPRRDALSFTSFLAQGPKKTDGPSHINDNNFYPF